MFIYVCSKFDHLLSFPSRFTFSTCALKKANNPGSCVWCGRETSHTASCVASTPGARSKPPHNKPFLTHAQELHHTYITMTGCHAYFYHKMSMLNLALPSDPLSCWFLSEEAFNCMFPVGQREVYLFFFLIAFLSVSLNTVRELGFDFETGLICNYAL